MTYSSSEFVPLFKALADETRLKILSMLTGGELCACKILESFHITQPTLSYHMKILIECGLVTNHKEGAWMYYQLNHQRLALVADFWQELIAQALVATPVIRCRD